MAPSNSVPTHEQCMQTFSSVVGCWAECLPNNRLADIRGNEQRDAGAKAIALLQQLIQQNDNDSGQEKLQDQDDADSGSEV